MTTPEEYMPVLSWYTSVMEQKLGIKTNINKSHWKFTEDAYLYERLADELMELSAAIIAKDDAGIILECADVSNFSMMIAHKAKLRLKDKVL